MTKPTLKELQDFVLSFERKIVEPLEKAGFERNKYNVFDILNISRQELRHSDFLAFLMNPNRSGEVGKQFLQSFLSLLAQENPNTKLDFFNIYYGNFEFVAINREYNHIDILLEFKVNAEKYVLVIENKVDSSEQIYDADNEFKGQLEQYRDFVAKNYDDYKSIFLLLSPNKREAIGKEKNFWIAVDYNLIYNTLVMINTKNTDNTIQTLVNDYKKLIGRQFKMNIDEELRKIGLKIYREPKNRQIFDFIFSCIPNRIEKTATMFTDYIEKNDWLKYENGKINTIEFSVNEINSIRDDLKILFHIEVEPLYIFAYLAKGTKDDKIALKIENNSIYPRVASKKYLDGDKKKTNEIIDKLDNYLLNDDIDSAETELKRLIDKVFCENGYVKETTKYILDCLNKNKI